MRDAYEARWTHLLSDLNLVDQPGVAPTHPVRRDELLGRMVRHRAQNLDELTEVIATQFWGRTL